MHRLIILAEALEALGEGNSADLARALALPQVHKSAEWANRFFQANPELLQRAEEFTKAKGLDFATYLNQLDALQESIGRQKIHNDLGYVGMPSPIKAKKPVKQEQKSEPKQEFIQTSTELKWPFPPPNVLQDERAFLAASLAWAMTEGKEKYEEMFGSSAGIRNMGKKGEIQAARAYLRYLMKDVAPQLAATLQAKWREASDKGDVETQKTLRTWWSSLSDVWGLLQRMIKIVNSYEK